MIGFVRYTLILVAALYILSSKQAYTVISKFIADIMSNVHDGNNIVIIVGVVLIFLVACLLLKKRGVAK